MEVLEAYGDYLLFGSEAAHPIAQAVGVANPHRTNKPSSLVPKLAAVRLFLRLSERVRKELLERSRFQLGLPVTAATDDLLPELGRARPLKQAEIRALRARSMERKGNCIR